MRSRSRSSPTHPQRLKWTKKDSLFLVLLLLLATLFFWHAWENPRLQVHEGPLQAPRGAK